MSTRNPMNDRYTKGRTGGATRQGASSMKPVRSAASSVRIEAKKPSGNRRQRAMAEANMSKEEKKALRAKQREEENTRYTASSILCNKDPKYKKLRRYWWVLLVAAVIFTGLSFVLLSAGSDAQIMSIVVLVLAYASIIGALIMDFTVVRKRRNHFRDKVNGMSKRAIDRIVEESYQERVAKEAAKKAKKEARKSGKSAEEAQAVYDKTLDGAMKIVKEKAAEAEAADGKASKGSKGTKVAKVVSGGSDAASGEAELSDEERAKAAAAKAAREYAASKRR